MKASKDIESRWSELSKRVAIRRADIQKPSYDEM